MRIVLRWLPLLIAAFAAQAQIVSPDVTSARAVCGKSISKDAVLVLDLEPLQGNQEKIDEFIGQHAARITVVSLERETLRTPRLGSRTNRDTALKLAQHEAAERGCNLALVWRAWKQDSGKIYSQAVGSSILSAALFYGMAEVSFGRRD
jgi:hypothetical protein